MRGTPVHDNSVIERLLLLQWELKQGIQIAKSFIDRAQMKSDVFSSMGVGDRDSFVNFGGGAEFIQRLSATSRRSLEEIDLIEMTTYKQSSGVRALLQLARAGDVADKLEAARQLCELGQDREHCEDILKNGGLAPLIYMFISSVDTMEEAREGDNGGGDGTSGAGVADGAAAATAAAAAAASTGAKRSLRLQSRSAPTSTRKSHGAREEEEDDDDEGNEEAVYVVENANDVFEEEQDKQASTRLSLQRSQNAEMREKLYKELEAVAYESSRAIAILVSRVKWGRERERERERERASERERERERERKREREREREGGGGGGRERERGRERDAQFKATITSRPTTHFQAASVYTVDYRSQFSHDAKDVVRALMFLHDRTVDDLLDLEEEWEDVVAETRDVDKLQKQKAEIIGKIKQSLGNLQFIAHASMYFSFSSDVSPEESTPTELGSGKDSRSRKGLHMRKISVGHNHGGHGDEMLFFEGIEQPVVSGSPGGWKAAESTSNVKSKGGVRDASERHVAEQVLTRESGGFRSCW